MEGFIKLEEILNTLEKLQENTAPQWGQMNAQQMIEHLADTLNSSNGTFEIALNGEPERAERLKIFLNSERPLSKNLNAPQMANTSKTLRNSNFNSAVSELKNAFDKYFEHFENHPEIKHTHPVFGELNKTEWDLFHRKHFTHHFTQFGII